MATQESPPRGRSAAVEHGRNRRETPGDDSGETPAGLDQQPNGLGGSAAEPFGAQARGGDPSPLRAGVRLETRRDGWTSSEPSGGARLGRGLCGARLVADPR